ncbi:MAG: MvdC/MvdD family ATP grasp protein [Bacteroidota bacterium]
MSENVLIITNSADLHADIMVSLLRDKGVHPFRINLDAFPRDFEINKEIHQNQFRASIRHIPSSTEVDFKDIGAVWTRKPADFTFLSEDLINQEKAYADQETDHVLNSLLYSLDCYWMNHPLAVRSALWKGEQSIRAAKMGFKIPMSLITNKPESVRQFVEEVKDEVIFKAMSSPFLGAEKVAEDEQVVTGLGTTIVTEDHMQNVASVKEVPCYFQEYIAKKFELRVTIIGEHVFAAKIDSQQSELTKIDFRDFSAEIQYEPFDLTDEMKVRCRDFVHSYDLQYGAMDIIVTPEDEYVFLENNPGGEFLFVQQLVPEFNMMETLADYLIKGAKCYSSKN